MEPTPNPFQLGHTYMMPGVRDSVHPNDLLNAMARYARNDWGECDDQDWQANDLAVSIGRRILASYSSGDTKFWIITEADRSSTVVLLPEEY